MYSRFSHALRRAAAVVVSPPSIAVSTSIRQAASSNKHLRFTCGAMTVVSSQLSRHDGFALCGSYRLLFQNRKTFPTGGKTEQHEDDTATAEKGEKLFKDTGKHENQNAEEMMKKMPSVAELHRILPSVQQLKGELPSSEAVRGAVEEGDASKLLKKAENDKDNHDAQS